MCVPQLGREPHSQDARRCRLVRPFPLACSCWRGGSVCVWWWWGVSLTMLHTLCRDVLGQLCERRRRVERRFSSVERERNKRCQIDPTLIPNVSHFQTLVSFLFFFLPFFFFFFYSNKMCTTMFGSAAIFRERVRPEDPSVPPFFNKASI